MPLPGNNGCRQKEDPILKDAGVCNRSYGARKDDEPPVGRLPGQNRNDLVCSGQLPRDRPDLSSRGEPRSDNTNR
jgi:hypothetical protein